MSMAIAQELSASGLATPGELGQWVLTDVASMHAARREISHSDLPHRDDIALVLSEAHTNNILYHPDGSPRRQCREEFGFDPNAASAYPWNVFLASLGGDAILLAMQDTGPGRYDRLLTIDYRWAELVGHNEPGRQTNRGLQVVAGLVSSYVTMVGKNEVTYQYGFTSRLEP